MSTIPPWPASFVRIFCVRAGRWLHRLLAAQPSTMAWAWSQHLGKSCMWQPVTLTLLTLLARQSQEALRGWLVSQSAWLALSSSRAVRDFVSENKVDRYEGRLVISTSSLYRHVHNDVSVCTCTPSHLPINIHPTLTAILSLVPKKQVILRTDGLNIFRSYSCKDPTAFYWRSCLYLTCEHTDVLWDEKLHRNHRKHTSLCKQ